MNKFLQSRSRGEGSRSIGLGTSRLAGQAARNLDRGLSVLMSPAGCASISLEVGVIAANCRQVRRRVLSGHAGGH